MGRIPTIAQLERQLQYAKTREQRLDARQKNPPRVGTQGRRPTESVKYSSIYMDSDFVINAPRAGIQFFGGIAALGLAQPDGSPRLPAGAKPAKIIAVRGRSAPKIETATLSGRRYLKYSIDGNDSSQSTFSAPVSADSVAALKTRIQTLMRDKTDDVGEYGRISFEPERPIYSTSGEGTTAPTTP